MEIKIDLPISLHIGTIEYENLEGGFWRLNENNTIYNLNNLPHEFRQEGIRVAILLKKSPEDVVNIFMNGIFYEVLSIKKID